MGAEARTSAAEVREGPPPQKPRPTKKCSPNLVLAGDSTVADAARTAIAHGRDTLDYHRMGAAAGETESIHQLRVTARRLRATLLLFSGVMQARYVKLIDRELTWMAQAPGSAREREINDEIFRSRASKLDPSLTEPLTHIYGTLERESSARLRLLRKVVGSRRYHALLKRLDHPRLIKHSGDALLGRRAAAMLRPIARSVARAGADLDERSSPRTIHRLRVRVKRLRYAIEMLSVFGGKRCRRLLESLEQLQELLGDLNDLSVATAWLIAFPGNGRASSGAMMAAGALVQSLRNRSAKLARRCVKAWRKFDKSSAVEDAIGEIRRNAREIHHNQTPATATVNVA